MAGLKSADPAHSLPITPHDAVIRDAVAAIDRGALGVTLAVDAGGRFVATITDGDIRRAMLAGADLDAPLKLVLDRKAASPYARSVTAAEGESDDAVLARMIERRVRQIPVLDADRRPVRIATLDAFASARPGRPPRLARPERSTGPMTAVIMAGGFGTRLGPLTTDTPKPMLKVGDRPLLEHTVERLRGLGVGSIAISTHYLAGRIREHFADGSGHGVPITYLDEPEPLGTAGCLAMLETPPTGPVLVLNGDILTNVDFEAMRRFHDEHDAAMTVAVRTHRMAVPYGVAECDGPIITSLVEKPTYSVLVNAGLYVLEPGLLGMIPRGRRYDMTTLIDETRSLSLPVCAFPLHEYWLDIGLPEDYARAQREAPEIMTAQAPATTERLAS